MKISSPIKPEVILGCIIAGSTLFCQGSAYAELTVSIDFGKDMGSSRGPDKDSRDAIFDRAIATSISSRDASPTNITQAQSQGILGINGAKFYMAPATFMAKSKPNEVCTRKDFKGRPTYQCEEGQRLTYGCHVFFYDADFKEVGFYTLKINEPFKLFCNAVVGFGVADKDKNELLMTAQYFPIDAQPARTPGELGDSWRRMTVLLRLQVVDGKITVEQDDRCLGNPNQTDTVPDARRIVRRCEGALK